MDVDGARNDEEGEEGQGAGEVRGQEVFIREAARLKAALLKLPGAGSWR